eukprot:m51a1_g6985 hypothetical protein (359) ;mRNA; f:149444-150520
MSEAARRVASSIGIRSDSRSAVELYAPGAGGLSLRLALPCPVDWAAVGVKRSAKQGTLEVRMPRAGYDAFLDTTPQCHWPRAAELWHAIPHEHSQLVAPTLGTALCEAERRELAAHAGEGCQGLASLKYSLYELFRTACNDDFRCRPHWSAVHWVGDGEAFMPVFLLWVDSVGVSLAADVPALHVAWCRVTEEAGEVLKEMPRRLKKTLDDLHMISASTQEIPLWAKFLEWSSAHYVESPLPDSFPFPRDQRARGLFRTACIAPLYGLDPYAEVSDASKHMHRAPEQKLRDSVLRSQDAKAAKPPKASKAPKVPKPCAAGCGAEGHLRCGRCMEERYCSPECQRADWPRHKVLCNKKP